MVVSCIKTQWDFAKMYKSDKANLNLILGVTGSVATLRLPVLVDQFTQIGFNVRIVSTQNGLYFFNPTTLGVPVYTDKDEWNTWTKRNDPVLHIEVSVRLKIFLFFF